MKKLFIIFAILCLAAPVMAADWNFFGSARFSTFYQTDDYDLPDGALYEDDDDLTWAQQGNSRIGANVKVNDQIGGGFEMGDSFNKRKLFGTYTFGGGSQLLLGQTYTPTALFYSNSVYDGDGDLLGVGEFYEGRRPMVQWSMGGLKVALITPTVDGRDNPAIDVILPKIEVGYNMKADMFFFDIVGGYQTYTEDNGTGNEDFDIDSYVITGGGGMNIGALFLKINGHYGINIGDYGAYNPGFGGFDPERGAVIVGNEVKDTTAFGAVGVVGFNMSEMLTFEAGVGYQNYEKDIDNTDDDTIMQYYLNATVNIAPGFFIVPEIGYITIDPDSTGLAADPNPNRLYLGAKWQINF